MATTKDTTVLAFISSTIGAEHKPPAALTYAESGFVPWECLPASNQAVAGAMLCERACADVVFDLRLSFVLAEQRGTGSRRNPNAAERSETAAVSDLQ